jgi:hypothetical protein
MPPNHSPSRRVSYKAPYDPRTTLSDIAPYIVSAKRIPTCPSHILYEVYAWVNYLVPALAAIGVSIPLFTKAVTAKPPNKSTPTDLLDFFSSTGPWAYVILIACVAWLAVKFLVERDDGLKRKTLMRVCGEELLEQAMSVTRALQGENTKTALTQTQKRINGIYDKATHQKAWPWPGGFAPNCEEAARRLIDDWVQYLRERHPEFQHARIPLEPGLAIDEEELRDEEK